MTRTWLFAALLLVVAASAGAADGPPRAPADRGALAEIVAREDVVTTPETPSLTAYARDLGAALMGWLLDLLSRVAPGLDAWVVEIARVGAGVVLAAALALLLLLLYRVLRDQLAGRPQMGSAPVVTAEAAAGGDRPRGDWAGELRRRLAAGNVAGACEALWWWLARALAGDAVEESWTSRELLARTGRRDLAAPVGRLERMTYGAAAPAAADVRGLWNELEETVG